MYTKKYIEIDFLSNNRNKSIHTPFLAFYQVIMHVEHPKHDSQDCQNLGTISRVTPTSVLINKNTMSAQACLNDRYEGKTQCPPKHVLMLNMKVKHNVRPSMA